MRLRLPKKISDALWWLRYRVQPRHKYHLVDTGLKPGYHEHDERMLHACFALLLDHVEEEGGIDAIREHVDQMRQSPEAWAGQDRTEALAQMQPHIHADEEKIALYEWWTITRPANHKRYDDMSHRLYSGRKMIWGPFKNGMSQMLGFDKPADESLGTREDLWALDRQNDEDDTTMLKRLVDIRGGLWS